MIKDVTLPKHLKNGIRGLVGGSPDAKRLVIFGADTETVKGVGHSIQIAGPDDFTVDFITPETTFPVFWKWIRARARYDGVNLCFFHNLNFDARVLFSQYHLPIYEQFNDIKFSIKIDGEPKAVEVKMLFGKVNTVTLTQGRVKISLLDSWAFTGTSLEKSLKMFKVAVKKRPRPKDIGQFADFSKEFKMYALDDAIGVRLLGLRIIELHELYDVKPSITLPSFAAKVFRTKFLGPNETIPFPPENVVRAAELSYHGGKNGYYLTEPKIIENVYEVDISSAYPHAMRELPGITKGKYKRITKYHPGVQAIYKVSGKTDGSIYPVVFNHKFQALPPNTEFKDLWITGHEMESVFEGDTRIDSIGGFCWRPGKGAINPFRRYVDHFYEKKQSSDPSDPLYQFYKLALNGLYGKLLGTVEIRSQASKIEVDRLRAEGVDLPEGFKLNERWDSVTKEQVSILSGWRASSMYNPFWGSQITGATRRYLHTLEKKLGAIHSATDSVKATKSHAAIPGLGGLKVECYGRSYLFRNKLYLHCSHNGEYCKHKTPPYKYPDHIDDFKFIDENGRKYLHVAHKLKGKPLVDRDGQHLCKFALHGFKSKAWLLWHSRHKLIKTRELLYDYVHVVGLREGMLRGETPCDFVPRRELLRI